MESLYSRFNLVLTKYKAKSSNGPPFELWVGPKEVFEIDNYMKNSLAFHIKDPPYTGLKEGDSLWGLRVNLLLNDGIAITSESEKI